MTDIDRLAEAHYASEDPQNYPDDEPKEQVADDDRIQEWLDNLTEGLEAVDCKEIVDSWIWYSARIYEKLIDEWNANGDI